MNDNKIPFMEEIPNNWEVLKNKYLYKETSVKVGTKFNEYELLSLTTKGVKVKDINDNSGKLPESFEGYQTVKKNDLILCLFDLDCSAVFSGLSEYDGMITSAYNVLENNHTINSLYSKYWFEYMFDNRKYKFYSKSLRYTINNSMFKEIYSLVPPIEIQEKIVGILDNKINKVNDLINIQKQSISEVELHRKNMISDVIINFSKTDNNSNGNNFIKLKYCLTSNMQYGANESGSEYTNDSVRYIRITDITTDNKLKNNESNLFLLNEKANDFILENNDVLFARSGGTVGKTFIYRSDYGPSAFAGYLIRAKCNPNILNPNYLFYYSLSNMYQSWKNQIFIQATIQNIGAQKYENMVLNICDIKTQDIIINYLDDKCSKIDELIKIKKQKIEELNSYKKSLIYEYVTGKKEV